MKEQFDKKLAKKIADTFSQHEEPFDPKEWEKLAKVYFPKTEKIFPWKWIFISSGIAAAILVGFLLLPQPPSEVNSPQLADSSQSKVEGYTTPNNDRTEKLTVPDVEIGGEVDAITPKETLATQVQSSSDRSKFARQGSAIPDKALPKNELTETLSKTNSSLASASKDVEEATQGLTEKTQAVEPFTLAPQTLLAEENKAAIAALQKWLEEGDAEKADLKKEKSTDPFRLGVMVAPQTISNATQSLNLGAGIMSEFAFSKRLKLDVGLAYARQTINPESPRRGDYSVAQAADFQQVRMSSISSNFITSTNRLSFGQLEIPVNLKYRILENKSSGWYLMSGLSNMMYINQQQITTFSTANFGVANFGVSATPQVQTFESVTTPSADQGSINMGQLLNLGFGFEQNLKNGTFVYIEPFYKFSLGNQTFAEQQFSIGGINLRMNFQLKK